MIPLLLAAALVAPASDPGASVERMVSDPRISESSGLTPSPAHLGFLWTHDDSGNPPLLFGLAPDGHVAATLHVSGVPDRDWEAIAAFRDLAGRPLIAVGDLGDNLGTHQGVEVDVLEEPRRLHSGRAAPLLRLRLTYPDGPQDAETLLVDARSGRMFVVTKGLLSSNVYLVPPSGWDGSAPERPTVRNAALVPLGSVPFALATDGTVAPSGAVLLRNYSQLAVLDPLPLREGRRLLVPRVVISLPPQPQGEGLALEPDARAVLLSSEGHSEPILRFRLPTAVERLVAAPVEASRPTPPSSGPAAASTLGSFRQGWARRASTAVTAGILAALALAVAGSLVIWRRYRR